MADDAASLRRGLRVLTRDVRTYLRTLDTVMKQPATEQRGREIARLSNALEMANDRARYFVLGDDYRNDARASKPRRKATR